MSGPSDDRVTGLLGALRNERMDRLADERIRARLENAWTTREQRRRFGWRVRRIAPILATLVLFAGLAAATLNASGDSVLYGIRIAVEDAAVALHTNPEDRNEYLLSLLEQRQAEAARLESSGSALAASHVRQIEQQTLARLMSQLPPAQDDQTAAQAGPTETPTPAPIAAASPTPPPTATPVVTVAPTLTARTPVPTHTDAPTPTPLRTPAPPPTPTGSAFPTLVTGLVKNPDGTAAANVCVFQSTTAAPGTSCLQMTGLDGIWKLTMSVRLNQIVTVYYFRQDGTVALKGTASATVRGSTVTEPTTYLQR